MMSESNLFSSLSSTVSYEQPKKYDSILQISSEINQLPLTIQSNEIQLASTSAAISTVKEEDIQIQHTSDNLSYGTCPICNKKVAFFLIEEHAINCLNQKQTPIIYTIDDSDDDNTTHNETTEPTDRLEIKEINLNEIRNFIKDNTFISNDGSLLIRVRRHREFEDFSKFFSKQWNKKKLNKLYKILFIVEPAVDTGGVSREFYTESLKAIKERYFTGDEANSLEPFCGIASVADGTIKSIGHVMAASIVNGGPAPAFVAPWIYEYIVNGLSSALKVGSLKIDKSSPYKDLYDKLVKATTNKELLDVVVSSDGLGMMEAIGYRGNPSKANLDDKVSILECIVIKSKLEPFLPIINELSEGLKCYGVVNMIRQNPQIMRPVFCYNENYTWKFEEFSNSLQPKFSEGNRKQVEVQVYKAFLDFTEYCFEDDEPIPTSKELLQFLTGSCSLPVLGLPNDIAVNFIHGCQAVRNRECNCLPTVSTCDLQLNIPVHINSEENMKNAFAMAVYDGCHFGQL